MFRSWFALTLLVVCATTYAQRPDNANRRPEIRSGLASHPAARQGLAGSAANMASGASAASLDRGLRRGRERLVSPTVSPDRSFSGLASSPYDRAPRANRGPSDRPNDTVDPDHITGQNRDHFNAHGIHLTGHERALQVQLAAVDRWRDKAIESGDQELLDRADEWEHRIREQFSDVRVPEEQPVGSPLSEIGVAGGAAAASSQFADNDPLPRRSFAQAIAEQARTNGSLFGAFTSEEAESLGRSFGESNADKTRPLPVAIPLSSDSR